MFIPYIQLCNTNIKILFLKKHYSILEALEQKNIIIDSQCREGYCGICRTLLICGTIQYSKQPLAYIKQFEILTCCSSPTSNIQIKLNK